MSASERIANIGDRGARRRVLGGIVWLAIAAIAFVALLGMHAPRWWRVVLVIPFTFAAVGWLQARVKT